MVCKKIQPFDSGCGSSFEPTVYTNISSVLPWMKNTIEDVYGKPIKLLVSKNNHQIFAEFDLFMKRFIASKSYSLFS